MRSQNRIAEQALKRVGQRILVARGDESPFSPSSTISGMAPVRVDTTGNAIAIASKSALGVTSRDPSAA